MFTDYEAVKERLEAVNTQRMERERKADALGGVLFAISEGEDCVKAFDPKLWAVTVDTATVQPDGTLDFQFKNGRTIRV